MKYSALYIYPTSKKNKMTKYNSFLVYGNNKNTRKKELISDFCDVIEFDNFEKIHIDVTQEKKGSKMGTLYWSNGYHFEVVHNMSTLQFKAVANDKM